MYIKYIINIIYNLNKPDFTLALCGFFFINVFPIIFLVIIRPSLSLSIWHGTI